MGARGGCEAHRPLVAGRCGTEPGAKWATGHRLHTGEVPWCLFACGVGHVDTIAHYVCCRCAREWCSHATFCDNRRMQLREWLGLTLNLDVGVDVRATVAGASRIAIRTLAYRRVRALWTTGGCKRSSSSADACGCAPRPFSFRSLPPSSVPPQGLAGSWSARRCPMRTRCGSELPPSYDTVRHLAPPSQRLTCTLAPPHPTASRVTHGRPPVLRNMNRTSAFRLQVWGR